MKPNRCGHGECARLRNEKYSLVSLVSFVVKALSAPEDKSAIGNRQSAMVFCAYLMRLFRPMLCGIVALILTASALAADTGTEAAQRLAAQIAAKVA